MDDGELTLALISLANAAAGAQATERPGKRPRLALDAHAATALLTDSVDQRLNTAGGPRSLLDWVRARLLAVAEHMRGLGEPEPKPERQVEDPAALLRQRKLDPAFRFLLSAAVRACLVSPPEEVEAEVLRLLEAEADYQFLDPPMPFAWAVLGIAEALPGVVAAALVRARAPTASLLLLASDAMQPHLAQAALPALQVSPEALDLDVFAAACRTGALAQCQPSPALLAVMEVVDLAALAPVAADAVLLVLGSETDARLRSRLAQPAAEDALYAWAVALTPRAGELWAAGAGADAWLQLAASAAKGAWASTIAASLVRAAASSPSARPLVLPPACAAATLDGRGLIATAPPEDLARTLLLLTGDRVRGLDSRRLLALAAGAAEDVALAALTVIWTRPPVENPLRQLEQLQALVRVLLESTDARQEACAALLVSLGEGDRAFHSLLWLLLDACFAPGWVLAADAFASDAKPVIAWNALGPPARFTAPPPPVADVPVLLSLSAPAPTSAAAGADDDRGSSLRSAEAAAAVVADLLHRLIEQDPESRATALAEALAGRLLTPQARLPPPPVRMRPEPDAELERIFAAFPGARMLTVDLCVRHWPQQSSSLRPVVRAALASLVGRLQGQRTGEGKSPAALRQGQSLVYAEQLLAALLEAGWLPPDMRDCATALGAVAVPVAGRLLRACYQSLFPSSPSPQAGEQERAVLHAAACLHAYSSSASSSSSSP